MAQTTCCGEEAFTSPGLKPRLGSNALKGEGDLPALQRDLAEPALQRGIAVHITEVT